MKGKNTFTQTEITQLKQLIQLRIKANPSEQKFIRNQMRNIGFYGRDDFGILDLQPDDLNSLLQSGTIKIITKADRYVSATTDERQKLDKENKRSNSSDESYVLNICDKILGIKGSRQHRFDFLFGDSNRKLPVDSYYEKFNLVIEYREIQHSESITFFDKINKLTVSGVHRGEQRRIYDQRRRDILPMHNIQLIEISYLDFTFDKRKRIIRDFDADEKVVKNHLQKFIG
jgi:hypothetical protein